MSIRVMSDVMHLDVPREEKLVLMLFADHADDNGLCYPSVARIAWLAGYTQKRSAAAVIKKLIDRGVLVLLQRPTGRRSAVYQVRPDKGSLLPEFDPSRFESGSGATTAPIDEDDDGKPLNANDNSEGETPSGADIAPKAVAVRSGDTYRCVPARVAVRPTAPEPINRYKPSARTRQPSYADAAAALAGQDQDPRVFAMNNTAKLLRIPLKASAESVEDFEQRIERAHGEQLAKLAAARQAERAESENREAVGA